MSRTEEIISLIEEVKENLEHAWKLGQHKWAERLSERLSELREELGE